MFNTSVFNQVKKVSIPNYCKVIFVSDLFSEDHIGGAELTTDAIIDSSPVKVFRLHSKDVSMDLLEQGVDKFWIFGNFSSMSPSLIPSIVANIRYSIVEYDYKYCRYRSPEKHFFTENQECNCQDTDHGKLLSAFFYGAASLWWMSRLQMNHYHDKFPFLKEKENRVLSSVFNEEFFNKIREIHKLAQKDKRAGWLVTGSTSWIKGTQAAERYCEENGLAYETVWNIPYEDMINKLSESEGLVFLPPGSDTCPRLVIEAKLLGCAIITNSNVQHANEPWFNTEDISEVFRYLYGRRKFFWDITSSQIERKEHTLSGYTTTLNCIDQGYPFIECIKSMLGFCEQVVVVDGGSEDGTWEKLKEISDTENRLLIHQNKRDWNHPRFAVFDGLQKALARALCTGSFCWQQDSDEIVHSRDYPKIREILNQFPNNVDLIALPVIEYWGSKEKVRVDVNPWKWRLSKNKPHITHGVPSNLRKFDETGHLYASPGTDGCDYIRSDTYETVPCGNFYTQKVHSIRSAALAGDKKALEAYESWINNCCHSLPSIQHFSWFNIGRKIRTYRDYWSNHWQSLYNIKQEDIAENNMFFDKPWEEVSEKEIDDLSEKLSSEMGGWVFHSRVDFNNVTPYVDVELEIPEVMTDWVKEKS